MTFRLQEQRYAIDVEAVERVVRAVHVTAIPKATEAISGVVNVRGSIVPVINIRRRLNVQEREIGIRDVLVIARTSSRVFAFAADEVEGVYVCPPISRVPIEAVAPGAERLTGFAKIDGDVVLINDLESLFSGDDQASFESALPSEE